MLEQRAEGRREVPAAGSSLSEGGAAGAPRAVGKVVVEGEGQTLDDDRAEVGAGQTSHDDRTEVGQTLGCGRVAEEEEVEAVAAEPRKVTRERQEEADVNYSLAWLCRQELCNDLVRKDV